MSEKKMINFYHNSAISTKKKINKENNLYINISNDGIS